MIVRCFYEDFKMGKKFFIVIFALIIIVVGSGFIYEAVSESQDLKNYPAPGKIINVDGHDMHVYIEGQGPETVVFAAGWG